MTRARTNATGTTTLGSTALSLGGTTTTVSGLTLSSPTIGTITNTGTITLPTTTDTLVGRTTTDTLTNKTLTLPAINGASLAYPIENWYVVGSAVNGWAFSFTNGGVQYSTVSATGTAAINFGWNIGTTTLNTALVTGQAVTGSLLVTNGATPYYINAVQVDGTTTGVTTKWTGGTAPSAGNASAIDVYQFTIIKTGSATWTVLAAGPVKYA